MTKELVCILCPLGCRVKVEVSGTKVGKVLGIRCKKGAEYAKQEISRPTRILTTTVKTGLPDQPLVPVRSDRAVPKDMLMACMKEIAKCKVDGPVQMGQVVIKGILGLDADIIACRSMG